MKVLMKKKMERQQKEDSIPVDTRRRIALKRSYVFTGIVKYGETPFREGGGVEILVNIWGMLDWILTQNCRNTLSMHN